MKGTRIWRASPKSGVVRNGAYYDHFAVDAKIWYI